MFLNPCAGAPGNGLLAPGGLTLIEGQGLLLCYLDPAHQWALDLVWGVGTDHSPWAQGSEHAGSLTHLSGRNLEDFPLGVWAALGYVGNCPPRSPTIRSGSIHTGWTDEEVPSEMVLGRF